MDCVNLGKTGPKVSGICLCCMSYGAPPSGKVKLGSRAWALNGKESEPCFRQALDLGINLFDTAPKIGNFRIRTLFLGIQLLKCETSRCISSRKVLIAAARDER
jgi:hypothetical protein